VAEAISNMIKDPDDIAVQCRSVSYDGRIHPAQRFAKISVKE
jgi:hypothetical protein